MISIHLKVLAAFYPPCPFHSPAPVSAARAPVNHLTKRLWANGVWPHSGKGSCIATRPEPSLSVREMAVWALPWQHLQPWHLERTLRRAHSVALSHPWAPEIQAKGKKCLFQRFLSDQNLFGICIVSKNKQTKSLGPLLGPQHFLYNIRRFLLIPTSISF